MATFQTLYSGSSGNCSLIRDGFTALLIDMGKNCKATLRALSDAGIAPGDLDGILITHEHSDHIAGLNVFLKYYPVPIFASDATLEYLFNNMLVPRRADMIGLLPQEELILKDVTLSAFRTNHDSADCFGYRFLFGDGKKAAVATDLGCVTEGVRESLADCDFVGIESNYDDGMLRLGRYPAHLKRRIASPMGHLSNFECAETVTGLASHGTGRFMLMHLSEENNAPQIALTTCLSFLENQGISDCVVEVAPRHALGSAVEI